MIYNLEKKNCRILCDTTEVNALAIWQTVPPPPPQKKKYKKRPKKLLAQTPRKLNFEISQNVKMC